MGFIRTVFFLAWLASGFVILAGFLQLTYFTVNGEFLYVSPASAMNFLEQWAILGFLLDAIVIGLIWKWFVRRKAKKTKEKTISN